jgi:long-chain acyl-CoA synthetase
VPDERLGEEIKAYLTLKPGEQGTRRSSSTYVKERLAAYKYPRIVEVIDEMPKSATGKILKKELANRG